MIEAVFEDPKIKEQVWREIEPHVAADALLGSNTSTLPITGLAEYVNRPDDFIGVHFFSPVDKMPLVELIRGERTSDEATFKALDFVKQIKKTPIVVNDSRGFFTSRVIGTFINEGIAMLAEGVPAPSIEQASSQAGYPAPVLQLSDELNLKLMRKIRNAAKEAAEASSSGWDSNPSEGVIDRMLDEFDRPGRLEGKGFYEYADGRRTGLWHGLRDAFPPVADPSALSLRDLEERMLFIEALESVRCHDEGVIESVADANIGSIFGIGFPAWTGGVLQYINGYVPAHGSQATGLAGFVARARELAATYGDRFEPPASLVDRAERGEPYSDELVAASVVTAPTVQPEGLGRPPPLRITSHCDAQARTYCRPGEALGPDRVDRCRVAVVDVVLNNGGSPGSRPQVTARVHRDPAQARHHKRKAASPLVRNARPQAGWKQYTGPVPILVYHALGPAPPGRRSRVCTSPTRFQGGDGLAETAAIRR